MSKVKFLFTLAILAFVGLLVRATSGFIPGWRCPEVGEMATVKGLVEMELNQPLSGTGTTGWTYTTGQQ